jgi:hypothetical protein
VRCVIEFLVRALLLTASQVDIGESSPEVNQPEFWHFAILSALS